MAFGVLTSSFEPFVSTTPRQDSSKPQLCVQGVGKSKCSPKMKFQSCKENWGDNFNCSGSFPPAWSHWNGDLGVTQE